MDPITTGRPLDENGDSLAGPALEMDPDGEAAELFRTCPYPLASGPSMETWAAITQLPERDGSDTPAMLVWLAPTATELPPHVHTNAPEYFRALRGEVTVVVEDDPHRLGPGEDVTVDPGDEHYFRNDADGYVAFHAEVPWAKTIETQMTTFGMDHDGAFSSDGSFAEPDFLQGLLLGEYLYDGTKITIAPTAVQRLLWATVGRLARAAGRQAVDDTYLEDAFWERHVEQPNL